ncbi:MAG TPA: ComEC/Rec2 family competence protein, partial [Thermosynechococcaceae cyanobacterium]
YTIPVNILVTPFISVLSLGGMASALAALLWSPAGSALAWLLKYPTLALLAIVDTATQLPGNGYAIGTLPGAIAIVLYALIALVWLQSWWRKRWWVALLLGVGLVFVPAWQAKANQFRVSVLATPGQPVLVVEDGNRTALINSGDAATAKLTLLPFLQKAGVNGIDWALSTEPLNPSQGWSSLRDRLPIQHLYSVAQAAEPTALPNQPLPLGPGSSARLGSTQLKILSANPAIVEFQIRGQTWLWLGAPTPSQQTELLNSGSLSQVQVLWWSGKRLRPELLEALHPKVAIAANTVNREAIDQLRRLKARLYWTGRDGAIQWTAQDGFKTTLETDDNNPSAL